MGAEGGIHTKSRPGSPEEQTGEATALGAAAKGVSSSSSCSQPPSFPSSLLRVRAQRNHQAMANSAYSSWTLSIWGSIQQLNHQKGFRKLRFSITSLSLWHVLLFARFTREMKHELITSSDMSGKWMDLPSPPAGPGSSLTTSYGKETGYGRKAHLGHQPDTSLFQCIYFLSCALTGVS